MSSEERQKGFLKSAVDFFEKNGFFIALGVCVLIVAIAVISLSGRQNDEGQKVLDASETTQGESVGGELVDNNKFLDFHEILPGEDMEENMPVDGKDAIFVSGEGEASSVSSDLEFIAPVSGSITFDYSMDQLTYSRTLEEWRTHSGLDIGAAIGTAVACVADGTVTDIKNDPGYGFTVIVDHGNGLKTVYANLANERMVQVNQNVNAGDIIGAVGDTALFECAEESHLHFEVWRDGNILDPKNFLSIE